MTVKIRTGDITPAPIETGCGLGQGLNFLKSFQLPDSSWTESSRKSKNFAVDFVDILRWKAGHATQVAKTLAHEIGHLIDLADSLGIGRGNILGRIAHVQSYFKRYMKSFEGAPEPLTTKEKAQLLKEARKLAESTEQQVDQDIKDTLNLTPEDVLSIWNQITPNITDESLLNYIKGMGTKQKKAIIKAAMNGQIAEEIQAFVAAGQSNRTTTPDISAIQSKYQSLLEAEIKKRGLLSESFIREELIALSEWWRPYDRS